MISFDALVNALLAMGLLLLLLLVIYLIDRVNTIEMETRKVMNTLTEAPSRSDEPYMGLSGKKLWDVMTGRSAEGLDEEATSELRFRYQTVLTKHVESLFQSGFKDGVRGTTTEPNNVQAITTAKGLVDSWIPSAQANALYQCGLNAALLPEAEWGPLRTSMDEAGQILWSKTQLETSGTLSEWLMPSTASSTADTPT